MENALTSSAAERKQAERAKRREKGFRPFEVWAHPADWPLIRKLVERLARRREKK
jgi:hypothetical protein